MTAGESVQLTADTLAVANRVLADAWDVMRTSPFTALQIEGRVTRLPDLGHDAAVLRLEGAALDELASQELRVTGLDDGLDTCLCLS